MEKKMVCVVKNRYGKRAYCCFCCVVISCCCCLQYDSSTLDLSYYTDHTKKQKRGSINLSKFIGIRPNAKIGNKENVFAIETEDRKYILRAGDVTAKTIWLAKLCELCGQGNKLMIT